MIEKSEIESKAKEFEIHPSNVERDYVFGWVLNGIFSISELKDTIFLKGGNALRKGYFEKTRFSKDLDFGIPDDIDPEVLLSEMNKVCDYIQKKSGVIFAQEKNHVEEKFPLGENAPLPDLKVYEVDLFFKDFYGNPEKFTLRISMDLTRYDKTIYPPVTVPLIHPYSDTADVACEIKCMKLEEIIATKLKCLMQRQSAPDLFDYAYSIQLLGGNLNKAEVREALIQKTIFDKNPYLLKSILATTDFDFFRNTWVKSIVCARQFMLQVEDAISMFIADLEFLFADVTDNGFAQFVYFPADVRAKIMQAARTQTQLRVRYKDADRIVEPYALKYMQSRDGNQKEYLYVYNRSGGNNEPGWRQFVASNLQSIENSEDIFKPQYPIEISKAGEMPENPYLFDPNRPIKVPRGTLSRLQRGARVKSSFGSQMKYVFKCSYCGKQSVRMDCDSSARPHKDKYGNLYNYEILLMHI